MKGLLYSFSLLLLFMTSCAESDKRSETKDALKGKAQGGYVNVIVVAEDWCWNKGLKEDVSFVFAEELKGLYQSEPNFDITHVRPKGFSSLFKKQRTILVFEVSKSVVNRGITFKMNKYSKGQLYIKISARDFTEASSILLGGNTTLREKLKTHRIEGLQEKIALFTSKVNQKILKNYLNVTLSLTRFYSPVVENDNFVYFGKKAQAKCQSGQNSKCSYQMGVFVSKMNYKSTAVFDKEAFTELRDSLTRKYIVGPDNGLCTYMELEKNVALNSKAGKINGHYCVEYRGWWNMVNATMGGPFISYLIVNEKTNELYLVDGFVFAPNFSKREFVNELEAMIKTINFN